MRLTKKHYCKVINNKLELFVQSLQYIHKIAKKLKTVHFFVLQ